MRDLGLVIMLLVLAWLAVRRPWVGVLGLVFVAIAHPQAYAASFMQGFPAYASLFAVVLLASAWHMLRERAWPRVAWDWRLAVLVLLWAQFLASTAWGMNPWAAWPNLLQVTKVLPLLILVLALIDTEKKLDWLLRTLALSVAVVMLKGGYWAVITGFQDRVYGPPNSEYGGNNEFAVATAMAIPLLAFWFRQEEDRAVRWVLVGLMVLGFLSAVSSWSRGGLLSASLVAFMLTWHSQRKWLTIPLLMVGVVLAFVGLPDAWFERMRTIGTPEQESSAATRLELWKLGWAHAQEHPFLGAGFGSWIYLALPTGGHRVWHSAYVDMLVEHGFPGLLLWGGLLLGTVASLTRLIAHGRRRNSPRLMTRAAMLRVSMLAYMVGAAFLSIAHWQLLYLLLVATILTRGLAKAEGVVTGTAQQASQDSP